jgi:hypothetical protein
MVLVYRKMMKTKKIALIGAGELGSRHLQGLAKCEFPLYLQIIDPNKQSLEVAKKRFEEIPSHALNKKIDYISDISDISSNLDLAIVATSSGVRLQVMRDLVSRSNLPNLILEKVLFQSVEDLCEAESMIEKHDIRCFVNCPKRGFESTKYIKSKIQDALSVDYSIEGSNWGIGCNAIHFLDNMAFFTGSTAYELNTSKLDKEIRSSKRHGYIEFTGEMTALFPKGQVRLVSLAGEAVTFDAKIETERLLISFSERLGKTSVFEKETGKEDLVSFKSPFQSELTHKLVEQIFSNVEVNLPSFRESAELHRPLLRELLRYYNRNTNSSLSRLNIT